MPANVRDYEPATALFVTDNDPLVFIQTDSGIRKEKLNPGGTMYMEIHEDFAEEAAGLFQPHGYITELKKDMQGKNRMIKAAR